MTPPSNDDGGALPCYRSQIDTPHRKASSAEEVDGLDSKRGIRRDSPSTHLRASTVMHILDTNPTEAALSSVGVDLGGTSIRVGLFDPAMRLLGSRQMKTLVAEGPDAAVRRIAAAIDELVATHVLTGSKASIQGIGIGSPGPIDLREGILGELPNLPGWGAFPLRAALAAATGLEVVLESDANAAAIAEWKLGAGSKADVDSMGMITLGTGVGSGFILNGEVWHGIRGMGGEVGHSSVELHGALCGCGTRGCLELYASAGGLKRLARDVSTSSQGTEALQALISGANGFSAADVGALALSGDRAAQLAFERFGFYLGLGVANVINTLDLPMILIGGGVADSWNLFAPAMFETVRTYSQIYRLVEPSQTVVLESDRTFIGPAALGPVAGLLGAGLLPRLAGRTGMSRRNEDISRLANGFD
jgi:glucokinase